jgi:hypothetical protein
MGDADGKTDLPGLSVGLSSMRPNEFDAWLSGSDSGAYRPVGASEIAERNELAAFRDLDGLLRERRRLHVLSHMASVEGASADDPTGSDWSRVEQRLTAIQTQITEIRRYLDSSGWETSSWTEE